MFEIIAILYFLVLLFFICGGLFVVYHLVKYSFSSKSMVFSVVLFVSVFCILLITNLILFFSIDVSALVSKNVIVNQKWTN
jgi:hypothetical protein